MIDLTGRKFGKLTVVEKRSKDKWGGWNWLCKCDCGNETVVSGGHLRGLKIKSCGCSKKESKNFTVGVYRCMNEVTWRQTTSFLFRQQ